MRDALAVCEPTTVGIGHFLCTHTDNRRPQNIYLHRTQHYLAVKHGAVPMYMPMFIRSATAIAILVRRVRARI